MGNKVFEVNSLCINSYWAEQLWMAVDIVYWLNNSCIIQLQCFSHTQNMYFKSLWTNFRCIFWVDIIWYPQDLNIVVTKCVESVLFQNRHFIIINVDTLVFSVLFFNSACTRARGGFTRCSASRVGETYSTRWPSVLCQPQEQNYSVGRSQNSGVIVFVCVGNARSCWCVLISNSRVRDLPSTPDIYSVGEDVHFLQGQEATAVNSVNSFTSKLCLMFSLGITVQQHRLLQIYTKPVQLWGSFVYRVIHKSLRDFRTRLRNNQDRHGRKEHINR